MLGWSGQCRRNRDLFQEALENRLSPEQSAELGAHLRGCPDCLAAFKAQLRAHEALLCAGAADEDMLYATDAACPVDEILAAFADGDVDPKTRVQWGEHVADCTRCAIQIGQLRTMLGWTHSPPTQVQAWLHAVATVRSSTPRAGVRLMPILAAAAAILLILAGVMFLARGYLNPDQFGPQDYAPPAIARDDGARDGPGLPVPDDGSVKPNDDVAPHPDRDATTEPASTPLSPTIPAGSASPTPSRRPVPSKPPERAIAEAPDAQQGVDRDRAVPHVLPGPPPRGRAFAPTTTPTDTQRRGNMLTSRPAPDGVANAVDKRRLGEMATALRTVEDVVGANALAPLQGRPDRLQLSRKKLKQSQP